MKKNFLLLFIGLISMFIFGVEVNAAPPSKLNTGKVTNINEYVSGYKAYLKTTSDNLHNLYCEVANLTFPSNKVITLKDEVDKGFTYILSKKPNTGDKNKDYYIMQMAVWWYKDIVTGTNNNLSTNFKNYCTNNRSSHDVCNRIYALKEGARTYVEPRGNITFSTNKVNFTEEGSYYVSDKITVTTSNLTTKNNLLLKGAPKNSSIINNTATFTNGSGTFQIRVPKNSVKPGNTISFSVEQEGKYNTYSAYDYYYGPSYQKVIYDVLYPTSHPTYKSKVLTLKVPEAPTPKPVYKNSLTVYKVDQDGYNLRGARLSLYSGDCLNRVCYSNDLYASWTSSNTPKIFEDLPRGYYTIVETRTPTGYETAKKDLIYIKFIDENYSYTMINIKETEVKPVRISKTDITGANEIAGATLIIKDLNGKEISSFISTTIPKYINLEAGEYTLIEKYAPNGYKLNDTVVYFKVDKEGNVSVKDSSGKYVDVEYITIINEGNDVVNISKLDSSTNSYLTGAKLVLKNEKGEIVATWTTSNESYNIALNAGDYTISETVAPKGYILNKEITYIRVLDDGTLMVKNKNGVYEISNGIIIYNEPELEEEIVVVPKTGLTSILTYTFGSLTTLGGAYLLLRNGQFSI